MRDYPLIDTNFIKRSFGFVFHNFFYLLSVYALFLVPVVIADKLFWNNTGVIDWVIKKFSLRTFHLIDDTILCLLILIFIFTSASLFKAIDARTRKSNIPAWEIIKQEWKQFPAYLVFLIVLAGKVLLWALLLVIPGCAYALYYSCAPVIFLTEHPDINVSLRKSRELIKANIKTYTHNFIFMHVLLLASVFPVYQIGVSLSFQLTSIQEVVNADQYIWYFLAVYLSSLVILTHVLYYNLYKELLTLPQPKTT